MSDLVNLGCSPVAATNLLKYYYNLNKKTYKKLIDISCLQTYYDLRYYMKTDLKTGSTTHQNVVAGYIKYISKRGYNVDSKHIDGTNDGLKVAQELYKNDRPVHLSLQDHYKYGDHSVIAVGYQKYKYSGLLSTTYETYILIADGWKSGYATRYVWGGCSGSWDYTTVKIS